MLPSNFPTVPTIAYSSGGTNASYVQASSLRSD
jgi:hypothetical protein